MSPKAPTAGRLILVPCSLDVGTTPTPIDWVVHHGVLETSARLQHWVVENAKSARAFLKRVDALVPLCQPMQSLQLVEMPRPRKGSHEVPDAQQWEHLLAPALQGQDVGLLSDAGLPAVADPGASLVAAAHRLGLGVEVLAGASSLTMALAASGLNGQRFAFEGYLPQDAAQRSARIRQLEQRSAQEAQTQMAIETPYRNPALLQALCQTLKPTTRLAVAWGLTSAGGGCRSMPIARWRQAPELQMPTDLPAVFLWLA